MKTAMQEMFDWMQKYSGQMVSADQVVLKANELIEKEKEQIMNAWYNGFDELRPFVDHSEEYYNKTYNQNK